MSMMLFVLAFPGEGAAAPFQGKRILWVESYHEGFSWSDGIARGVEKILDGTGVELRVVHMDTKRNPSAQHAEASAREASRILREFDPHMVMASDDNAQRYFVVPFLKGGDLPVVAAGINWDAGEHGYPAPNVTGMVEVNLLDPAKAMLRKFGQGDRFGYIAADSESERKNVLIYNARSFQGKLQGLLVSRFEEFLRAFNEVQARSDMLIMGGNGGIEGWDDAVAREFLRKHTRVPTGSFDEYLAPYVIFTFAKDPEEQGEWMALTALRVLGGESPASIPMVENRRVRLIVNLKLARAAGLVLPVSLLKTATVIGKEEE
ncbi:ABC transporter substrate-binding protein [Desulfomicrobium baculatum]|nr:ABC transporter substrate-binding protein [Desulfomicrobium baculatum]